MVSGVAPPFSNASSSTRPRRLNSDSVRNRSRLRYRYSSTCLPWSGRGEWVIPGRKPGTHMRKLGNTWRLLRARAGLPDVRLHDLRHSVASRALALGEELPMIGKLLGHRRIESTVRYAHLARTAVHEAAERVASSLAEDIL